MTPEEELQMYKLALHQAAVIIANWMPKKGSATVIEETLLCVARLLIKSAEEDET